MKTKDIQVGQPYFYEPGRAAWRTRKVNGDGAVFVLSTDTFVATTSHDRTGGAMPFYIRRSAYSGLRSSSGRTTGMLAVVVRTNVHEGDIPQEAREIVASMTEAQVNTAGQLVPEHVSQELRKYSCFADLKLVRPQALLGEWDEVYAARKEQAKAEFKRSQERAETQRTNARRWEDAEAEIKELLGEDVAFRAGSPRPGDVAGETRSIGIDVLEQLIRLAQEGHGLKLLIDTTG